MGKIIWLASYPKSGNTWVRAFLNNYSQEEAVAGDLGALDNTSFGGSSKSSYRQVTTSDVDQMDDRQIMALTPNAQAFIAAKNDHQVFVKTHNLLSSYLDVPLITPEATGGGIYIIRNPLDTVLSVADHFGLDLDKAIDFMNNSSGSTAPTETMVRQIFSSWARNVESWTEQAPFPVHVVRYEDLHGHPLQTFSKLLIFAGLNPDAKKVSRAVRQSSFKALKNQEKKHGFSEKSQHSRAFFRSGKTGQWKSKLKPDQVARFVGPNRDLMKKFGYLPKGS